MSTDIDTRQRILACVEPSPYAHAVTDYGVWAAGQLLSPLELLHVIDSHAPVGSGQDHTGAIGPDAQEHLLQALSDQDEAISRQQRTEGRAFLNRLRERACVAGATWIDVRQRIGTLEDTLSELQVRVELIVLGRRGGTAILNERELGGNVEWVVRAVRKPVLLVPDHFTQPSGAVFAFDGSSVNRRGVEMLSSSDLLKGLPIHLVMVTRPDRSAAQSIEAAAATLRAAGFDVSTELARGNPEQLVVQAIRSRGANLLVMGAYGHSPLRARLFGSHTSTMLRATRVAALMMR